MQLDLMENGFSSQPSGVFRNNGIIFGVDMSSSVHANNETNVIVLGEGPTQGLEDTTLYTEKIYSIKFSTTRKIFCLSLHYNGDNSYLFDNSTEIVEFKANDSESVANLLCLGNVSADFQKPLW